MGNRRQPTLDRLEVRLATYRETSAEARARAAERLRAHRAREAILIDTCHRVELVSVDAEPGVPPAQRRGIDAVRRVYEVVAGFDSAVVAEEQLLGQIRGAYEDALAAGTSGPILNELMQRALRFGRRVRSHARPGADRSLADVAVRWLLDRIPRGARVVVVGTGETGRLVATGLGRSGHPVTIVSQSAERGARALESLPDGDHHLVIGRLTPAMLRATPAVALAVRTPNPVLSADLLGPGPMPWTVDLSAPSAVAPAARDRLGERMVDLDRLGERHPMQPVLAPRVEARLRREMDEEVDAFVEWFELRRSADALAVLHHEADVVRRRHLERVQRRAGLDDAQLAAVDASSAAMVRELLRGPIVELQHAGADAALVRRLFRIDV